jgi:GNAT superfamily N-acetyltransferase
MGQGEYTIEPYRPDYLEGILEILGYLWGGAAEANLPYFRWKYLENPYAGEVHAVVALKGHRVTGFRGFFANAWSLRGKSLGILSPGDTCVHPDHRRRGLSIMMGRAAMEAYRSRQSLFLNLSCSPGALPGYLKMGFVPMSPRSSSTYLTVPGLFRHVLPTKFLLGPPADIGPPGREATRDDRYRLEFSDGPRPPEMAQVASKGSRPLSLRRDAEFFRWRFSSGRRRYRFLYLYDGDSMSGYAAMGIGWGRRAQVLDIGGSPGAVVELLESAKGEFDAISIWDFALDACIGESLERSGFMSGRLGRYAERRISGQPTLPVLIRPVEPDYGEEDWYLDGVDARDPGNWSIAGACSDAT